VEGGRASRKGGPFLSPGGGGRRLSAHLLDEGRDDEPLVPEDVQAVHRVMHVGDFGEPAPAGPGDLHGKLLGDDDVTVFEVRYLALALLSGDI
jgi:hypothetical protein